MSKIARRVVRASLAVGLLAGVSVVGATSASASSLKYGCTASYPEVCLGLYYSIDGFGDPGVGSEQVQADVDHNIYYQYVLVTPDGTKHYSQVYHSTAAGWGAKWQPTYHLVGAYQAYVETGSTSHPGSQSSTIGVSVY
jgi:hypothetical protein